MKNVAEEDLTGLVWGTGSVAFAALAPFIGGGPPAANARSIDGLSRESRAV